MFFVVSFITFFFLSRDFCLYILVVIGIYRNGCSPSTDFDYCLSVFLILSASSFPDATVVNVVVSCVYKKNR